MNLERNVKNVRLIPMGQFVLEMGFVLGQVTKKESEIVNVMIILLVGNVTSVMKIILCPRASVTSVTNHARLVSITVNDPTCLGSHIDIKMVHFGLMTYEIKHFESDYHMHEGLTNKTTCK